MCEMQDRTMAQVVLKSRKHGFELILTAEVTVMGNLPIEWQN